MDQPENLLAVFNYLPGAYLLLSPDLIIEAATNNYLQETLTQKEKLIGRYLFDVFPGNPDAPEAQGVNNLQASFEIVLATGQPHQMDRLRYDLLDPDNPGKFLEHYWLPQNTPVLNDNGKVVYIIHAVINVTENLTISQLLQESEDREGQARMQIDEQQKTQHLLERREVQLRQAIQHLELTNRALEMANNTAQDTQDTMQLLQAMLRQAPVGIGLFQGEEHIVSVANEQICAMWGYPSEQVLGKPLLTGVPELQGQGFTELLTEVASTQVPYVGTEVPAQVLRNGQLKTQYFNFVFQPVYDSPAGNFLGILNIVIDVTSQVLDHQRVQALNEELETRVAKRTQAMQAARAEAERQRVRLERLFMQAPAAICILNGPDLVYELVNPAFQHLFPGRELLEKPILVTLPEIENNSAYRTLLEVYKTGNTHEEQELLIPIRRPQDNILENRYFNFIQQARYDENESTDGVLVFAFEVTEQVKARQASEATAHQLRLLTDALPVLISYLDKEEKYRFTNQAYEPWFNQKPEDLLGRSIREVVGEKAYENVKEYISRALAGERIDFEATMPYRENLTKHIRTSYVPDVQAGNVIGFYSLVSDITQQVKARQAVEESEQKARQMAVDLAYVNKQLRTANRQLTHINIDLDNFIYTASHDLKTPILNIEGLMEALLDQLPPDILHLEPVERIAGLILMSVQRFKRTIDQLTEITKLQKENSTEKSEVNLAEVISDVQFDLAQTIQTTQAQLQVDITSCPTIHFSKKNLRSIVYNLLSNAIKYHSPDRIPQVRIQCSLTPKYQVVSFTDNGLGFDSSQEHKLFAMFQRLHSHVEGSGIGLYMVKKIVENAGGKIDVHSKVGEGSTFKVYFPINP